MPRHQHPCARRRCPESESLPGGGSAPSQSFEEPEIRGGIENCVLAITERVRQSSNDAENLRFLAFSRDGDFRRVPCAAPGGVERRILLKRASSIKMSVQCRERACF
jgi:hypothetical protein